MFLLTLGSELQNLIPINSNEKGIFLVYSGSLKVTYR